jgi:hypothetical protein
MYSLVKLLFLLLFISGGLLLFLDNIFFVAFHIILGFFFLVFFSLYIIKHLKKYKDSFTRQSKKRSAFWSGIPYLLAFCANIFSGLMLFFYSLDFVFIWNATHLYSSFAILTFAFLHLLTKK